jgi:DNA-directed RNA polymerase subunit RPC12/RpoP
MTEKKPLVKGLNCPECGGVLQVIEGETLVECPYCGLRSILQGERGFHHLQIRERVNREIAEHILMEFLNGHIGIAPDVEKKAKIIEARLIYAPFWIVWRRVMAWVLGQDKVESGNSSYYRPKEISIVKDMAWNGAACDISGLGVEHVPLENEDFELYDGDILERQGLIFQPVSTASYARLQANRAFEEQIKKGSKLERIQQVLVRSVREKIGMVHFPLWLIRYQYQSRTYQIVIDGTDGGVLFGNAPGNLIFRAAALVLGITLGVFMTITIPVLSFTALLMFPEIGGLFPCPIFLFLTGIGLIFFGYRTFRRGEEFEYRWMSKSQKKKKWIWF